MEGFNPVNKVNSKVKKIIPIVAVIIVIAIIASFSIVIVPAGSTGIVMTLGKVSDNVMQDGDVIESRFAVERRNRTIHARMREYLYELKHNDSLTTSIIPLGDGVAVSIKN